MTWLGIEVQVSCTMAYSGLLHEVHRQREERRQEIKVSPVGSEPQATTSMGINSNNLLDQMVYRMMGCMNQEVRWLESLIQQKPDVPSIPSICNQSNAMERMIGPERMGLMNRHPQLVTLVGLRTHKRENTLLHSGFTIMRCLSPHILRTS